MYTRSKAVRNTFLRYHFPIDRSFNSFRVSRMRAEREKNISYRFQNLWSGRRNGVTSRWTAVNPWLGNERSRAFVESNAHITYPLSSLLFHPEHDDLQTYYPLLLLFSSFFDKEKKGDTLEIFSVASN